MRGVSDVAVLAPKTYRLGLEKLENGFCFSSPFRRGYDKMFFQNRQISIVNS